VGGSPVLVLIKSDSNGRRCSPASPDGEVLTSRRVWAIRIPQSSGSLTFKESVACRGPLPTAPVSSLADLPVAAGEAGWRRLPTFALPAGLAIPMTRRRGEIAWQAVINLSGACAAWLAIVRESPARHRARRLGPVRSMLAKRRPCQWRENSGICLDQAGASEFLPLHSKIGSIFRGPETSINAVRRCGQIKFRRRIQVDDVPCLLSDDTVAKVGEGRLGRNNRIATGKSLNQPCVSRADLESMLLPWTPKIFLQQIGSSCRQTKIRTGEIGRG
jgi:hypothetical protein